MRRPDPKPMRTRLGALQKEPSACGTMRCLISNRVTRSSECAPARVPTVLSAGRGKISADRGGRRDAREARAGDRQHQQEKKVIARSW